jgi:hypothetical protein
MPGAERVIHVIFSYVDPYDGSPSVARCKECWKDGFDLNQHDKIQGD